jgi:Ca2+-binding RTX toxin-like protein
MDPRSIRTCSKTILGLALLSGAACVPIPEGATFSPSTGLITVYGTSDGDLRVVSVAPGGSIVVNDGEIPITGGVPTLANTVRIEMHGREGADFLELDESGGPLPGGLLLGGPGVDVLIGGSGNDEVDGGDGDDVALLGGGDDTFVWTPGGGLDTVEGEAGSDTLRFRGDDAGTNVSVYADAGRAQFFQDVASATDLDSVEKIEYLAHGGADAVVVQDMSGTALTRIDVDLSATAGGGDGQVDTIVVNGTQGDDGIGIAGEAGGIHVLGLQASVHIVDQEPAGDHLTVNALAGADVVDASGPGADAIQLVVSGGLGSDDLTGSEGNDELTGGDGNDLVHMGPGDDTFAWSPGDDNDTLEGEDGFDTLLFNGANVAENIDISAVGGRVRFFRNIAAVTQDVGTVEAIDFIARDGADLIVVNDLSGTDLLELGLDLAPASGAGGDGLPDSVILNGTGGDDILQVLGDASEVSVVGLPASVYIANPENAHDSLTIGTAAGEDRVHAAGLATPSLVLTLDGGDHDDVLIGGDGDDYLLGGDGDDLLQGGPGLDALDGGAGNNIIIP